MLMDWLYKRNKEYLRLFKFPSLSLSERQRKRWRTQPQLPNTDFSQK